LFRDGALTLSHFCVRTIKAELSLFPNLQLGFFLSEFEDSYDTPFPEAAPNVTAGPLS
jgi:hypothetical protein